MPRDLCSGLEKLMAVKYMQGHVENVVDKLLKVWNKVKKTCRRGPMLLA